MPPPPNPPEPEWPLPKFNIRVEDLSHPGANIFFESVHPLTALRMAATASFKWLYGSLELAPTNVESILLVLRPMPGVAHTFGSRTEKEIHFSLDHIVNSAARAKHEIMGVLVHEVVHCYQYNAKDTAPGGLIEGVADYVRLHCDLAPPHWKRSPSREDPWDAGYQTTAFFLDWIEQRSRPGTIRDLNGALKDAEWDAALFERLGGAPVKKLWAQYKREVTGEEDESDVTDEGFTLVPSYNPVYV